MLSINACSVLRFPLIVGSRTTDNGQRTTDNGGTSMRAVLLAGLAVGALGRAAGAQATERKTVPGADVAIYNLAGVLRLEQGSGADVAVEITRGGGDAAKLRIETGEIRGRQTLRVMYPDDDIVYDALGRWGGGGETTVDVREGGTFNVNHGDPAGGGPSSCGAALAPTSRR